MLDPYFRDVDLSWNEKVRFLQRCLCNIEQCILIKDLPCFYVYFTIALPVQVYTPGFLRTSTCKWKSFDSSTSCSYVNICST